MPTDPRIDAYIAKAADFARPVLIHIRKLVHKACPDVVESVKWGCPHFEIYGAMLCGMAGFKQHCAFGFWKASLLKDPEGILRVGEKASMGHFDRITSLKDLPADKILIAYIREAARLNKDKVKVVRRKTPPKKDLPIPSALSAAMKKNKKAQAHFEAFSASKRREYIEWIIEAKTEETREKRVSTTIEWSAEGKSRNWKYERK